MTTTKTKHTKGPWKYDPVWAIVYGPSKEEICAIHSGERTLNNKSNPQTAKSNAEFIVRACNSHYELIEALKICFEWSKNYSKHVYEHNQFKMDMELVRNTISKAERSI